jgi:ubiquinone/menaquinone biosynthesis C-methylase UbiE
VRQYFQRSALDFDLIYIEEKSSLRRFLDRRFRQDMYERYVLTLQECIDIRGKRILDVGCGSGRYCIELAKAGPAEVVGLDVAENTLKIASKLAEYNGLSDVCSFRCADFVEHQFDTQFHICLAIGLFDYIANPVCLLSKMRDITLEKIIMTFPSKSTYRMVIRKTRYWLKRCPLFLYNKNQIEDILLESRIRDYTIRKLSGYDNSGDFFVVARL